MKSNFAPTEPRFQGTTTEQRSKTMSRIRGKDTSIEILLRKELYRRGIRYRKNYKKLPGRPDIAITKYKIAIFCDGEYFHGGPDWEERKKKIAKGANADYWIAKIERNIERDIEKEQQLKYLGWTVIRFWGKDIKKNVSACADAVQEIIFNIMVGDGWCDY